MKLPTARQMQALDRLAINDFGIPGIVLMENAGLGTVLMMEQLLGPCSGTFAPIFIGPGNNGGDGLVIGRHLHQRGCLPIFFLLVPPDRLSGDAAVNMAIVAKLKLPCHLIDDRAKVRSIPALCRQIAAQGLAPYAKIDAIFGIGLSRPVTEHYADVIALINSRDAGQHLPVVAVDCPSGLDADRGKALGCAVQADFTATYGCAKPGHFINDGPALSGSLTIIDIGIPPAALAQATIQTEWLDRDTARNLAGQLYRHPASHKGSHGHLLIVAGSPGKTGAAILAGQAALRAGCGLVSLATPRDLLPIYATRLVEAMTIPLPGANLGVADLAEILRYSAGKRALVIGPGLGMAAETIELVLALYRDTQLPMVVDADAINTIAAHPDLLAEADHPRIFTPHPGELSRLLACSISDIEDDRMEAARSACAMLNRRHDRHILVLKGAGTLVVSGQGRVLINTTGNPGMATGGMGDVLSGIIGALLCQQMAPADAATAAVYLHGAAADILLNRIGPGYTAGEVADTFPNALKTLLNQELL